MAKAVKRTLNTPDFTGAFVKVFQPEEKTNAKTGEKWFEYGITALFDDGETLAELKAAATEIMIEKFGADKTQWPKQKSEKNKNGWQKPWYDQADKAKDNPDLGPHDKTYDGYKSGNLYLNLKTRDQPEVVYGNLQKVMKESDIYSGARFSANIDLYWYDNESRGIGVGLNCLMKVGDGEPLGAQKPKASDVFSPRKMDTSKASTAAFDDEDDEDPMA